MRLGAIIREYRNATQISMEQFAKRAGLSKSYVNTLERGYHPSTHEVIYPSMGTVTKCARAMTITVDDLLEKIGGDGIRVSKRAGTSMSGTDMKEEIVKRNNALYKPVMNSSIPVLGSIAARQPISNATDVIDYIDVPASWANDEYFAFKVRGDSMQPEICSDDIVVCKCGQEINDNERSIYVVNVDGDDATLKCVKITNNGIQLTPINKDYKPMNFTIQDTLSGRIQIRGRVVELRRNY